MSGLPPAVEALLAQLVAEVRELRLAVEALSDRHGKGADAASVALLQALWSHAGPRPFGVTELVRHAALADAMELRVALGGMNARQLGRRLRHLEGRALDGLVLYRQGEDRHGLVWRVSAVQNPQNSWMSALR